MFELLKRPTFSDEELTRKGRVLIGLVRTMMVIAVLAASASLLDAKNDLAITAGFYAATLGALFAVAALVQRGRVLLAGWVVSMFLWVLIASVTLFFGGLQGQNAGLFAVAVLLVGVVVGGRAAIVLAVASSAWCGLVAVGEREGWLPPQLAEYSVVNAWIAVTATLILTSVLVHTSLDSLRRMHALHETAARERDEALRRTIQAQKMEIVGTLTAGIAHDFNNLLTVIRAAAAVLRDGVDPKSESAEILDDLDTATSRASLMTRQLLAFGRAPSNRLVQVDLGELVSASKSMLPRLLGSAIQVETHTAAACWILADEAGLEQIVLNLAVNARDAMPRGGVLRLVVEPARDSGVVLSASDSGVGIEAAVLDRIFEPFFTTKSNGTGLGLATVRDRVARFSGTISVESEPGRGTTFTLRFPRVIANAPRAAKASVPAVTSGARRRVLLVEDDPLVRRSTTRMLELLGHDVVAVADGEEAIAVLDTGSEIACVVSDVAMPRIDGATLATMIAERHPDLPVVLVSGNAEPVGADLSGPRRAFVGKPIEPSRLAEALARVLE